MTTASPMTTAPKLPSGVSVEPLSASLLFSAKRAYTVRRIDVDGACFLQQGADVKPRSGDVVLARVVEFGQHTGLHTREGRRATLFRNDLIVVAYGDRYAPDQFEALVPPDLAPCHLVAAGGLASRVVHAHAKMRKPTVIEPLGLLLDASGERINLRRGTLPGPSPTVVAGSRPGVLAVFGSSMNAGKTTAVGCLVRGLANAGLRVGAAKVTGTGAGGDPSFMRDAGASEVLDFVDAGYPSTYRVSHSEILLITAKLVGELTRRGCDAIVLEVADGIFQQETAALLESNEFRSWIDGVLFAAGDALGAQAGVTALRAADLPLVGLAGLLSASPLAAREAEAATGMPVLTRDALCDSALAQGLLDAASSSAWFARQAV